MELSAQDKIGFLISKALIFLMIAVTGYLTVASMYTTIKLSDDEEIFFCGDFPLGHLLVSLLLVTIIAFLQYKRIQISLGNTYKIVLAVYAIILVYIVLSTTLIPIFDQWQVSEAAKRFLHHDYSSFLEGGYARVCDNQHGFIMYLTLIYLLFGEGNIVAAQIINVICLISIVVIVHNFLFRFDNVYSDLMGIILCLFIPLWGYVSFVYGTLPYATLSVIAVIMEIEYLHFGKSQIYMMLSAVCIGVAILLKTNALIILIAMIIYAILWTISTHTKQQRFFRFMIAVVLILLISLTFRFSLNAFLHRTTGFDDLTGAPRAVHIAMGFHSQNGRAPGWYDGYSREVFEKNGYDKTLTEREAVDNIKESLGGFVSNPVSLFSFVTKKIVSQWCEPTYESLFIQMNRESIVGPAGWLEMIRNEGAGNKFAEGLMNIIQTTLYAGAFLYFLQSNKRKKLDQIDLTYLPAIVFLGGFFFHLFWEASSQYTIVYVLMLTGYAIYGFSYAGQTVSAVVSGHNNVRMGHDWKRIILYALILTVFIFIWVAPSESVIGKAFKMNWGEGAYEEYIEQIRMNTKNTGVPVAEGRYRIHPYYEQELVLGVSNDGLQNSGDKAVVLQPDGENRVIIVKEGNNYVLRFQESQLVLDISEAKTEPGTYAQQWEYNGDMSQLFHFLKEENGAYVIVYTDDLVLTADSLTGYVTIEKYNKQDNQLWILER